MLRCTLELVIAARTGETSFKMGVVLETAHVDQASSKAALAAGEASVRILVFTWKLHQHSRNSVVIGLESRSRFPSCHIATHRMVDWNEVQRTSVAASELVASGRTSGDSPR